MAGPRETEELEICEVLGSIDVCGSSLIVRCLLSFALTTQCSRRLRVSFVKPFKVSNQNCRLNISAAPQFHVAVGRASLIWWFCIRKGSSPVRGRFSMDLDF